MNIIIIGQGAIGLLWYYKLAQQAENHVTLQTSQNTTNTPKLMSFIDINNQKHQQVICRATADDFKKAQIIIFCLKSYSIEKAFTQYRSLINKDTVVIFSHNGLIDESTLLNNNTNKCLLISMLTTHGSLRTNAFEIMHTGEGFCDIGLLQGEISNKQMTTVAQVLNTALPTIFWQDNIKEKQWLKLAVNCVINPLTTLHNIDNGQILGENLTQTIREILNEIILIAAKNELAFDLIELKKMIENVAKKTAKNCSSMRSDILAKRKTEIDSINGFIHHQGIKHLVPTPHNTELWKQVKKLEKKV
ncbi:MAG: 2-dehydropantoate 2-reductase [Colwelliaceae bacterium]|nr:2-dehydropantoate 2-reductase [Colwelliaceae bacterium]